jgi:amino acid permease
MMADLKSDVPIQPYHEVERTFSDEDHQRIDPESGVKRGLKTRHLSMMALAGSQDVARHSREIFD